MSGCGVVRMWSEWVWGCEDMDGVSGCGVVRMWSEWVWGWEDVE